VKILLLLPTIWNEVHATMQLMAINSRRDVIVVVEGVAIFAMSQSA